MVYIVWLFLDSVMFREAKLSNDNFKYIKSKHMWGNGVQLQCAQNALFIIDHGGVHGCPTTRSTAGF